MPGSWQEEICGDDGILHYLSPSGLRKDYIRVNLRNRTCPRTHFDAEETIPYFVF